MEKKYFKYFDEEKIKECLGAILGIDLEWSIK